MKSLDAQGTSALTPYPELLDALRIAAAEHSRGELLCPQRQVVPLQHAGALLSMLAAGPDLAAHKLVTFVPGNPERGLPSIQGALSVWDARTGKHLLNLDGATVTGRRTAALSMLGVELFLSRPPRRFHLFGTGTQARHHLEAIGELHPEATVVVSGRSVPAAEKFCAEYASRGASLSPARSRDDDGADVIITCTTSQEPVYEAPDRRPQLVIAVGAFTPSAAEIGAATVRASRVYVDDLDAARCEAGDLIRAGVDWAQVQSLAQGLLGVGSFDRPVLFKTVGHAAWDLAAARVAVAHSPERANLLAP